MRWVDALKAYAAKTGKYVVPKKGSKEYDEVKAMMGDSAKPAVERKELSLKEKVEAAAHKAEGKAIKAVEVAHKLEGKVMKGKLAAMKEVASSMPKKERKPRAPRKPRARASPVDRKPKEEKKSRKPRVSRIPRGKTEEATAHSANPEAIMEAATNAHLPGSAPSAVADLTGQVKKAVRRRPAVSRAVDAKEPRSAAPFSITDVKRELGA